MLMAAPPYVMPYVAEPSSLERPFRRRHAHTTLVRALAIVFSAPRIPKACVARNHVGEGVGATFDLAANFPERTGRRKHTIAHIVRIGRYPVGEAPVVEVVKQLQKERGARGV